jgi:hypothetical protein
MINEIFSGIERMMAIVVMACIIVFMAMCIDLVSGLFKAKQRKEIRSSYGLKRSLNKFIMYEGSMLIACGVDMLMHFCNLLKVIHLDILYGIPIVTCFLGIFLLAVEFSSVREKADNKTKTEISRVEKLVSQMVNKSELVETLTEAIVNANKNKGNDENTY